MSHRILVGSYTNEIYTLEFEPLSSSLTFVSAITVGHHPSWIACHPDDHSLIFAGLEQPEGKVVAVKFGEDGGSMGLGQSSSGGADPCSVLVTTNEFIISNVSGPTFRNGVTPDSKKLVVHLKYSSGTVVSLPISTQPPYFQDGDLNIVQLSGSGPNTGRQQSSHPHQVIMHPEREELLVPDLGADKVWRFGKNDAGKWEIRGSVQYSLGSGPRHVTFYGI